MTIERIAQHIEGILNVPFSSSKKPISFHDKYAVENCYELAKKAFPQHLQSLTEDIAESLLHSYSEEYKPSLRVSTLGKEPLLQALAHIGYEDYKLDNFFLANNGHIFEALVRFILRCRGFDIEYDDFYSTTVDFYGVKGHCDFVLKTPMGKRIVCEVKHCSENFLKGFLEPEMGYNEQTNRTYKTGDLKSSLSTFALNNDYRGYIHQLSVYSYCLDIDAMWIFYNKGSHQVQCVPLPNGLRDKIIPQLKDLVETIKPISTLPEVLDTFDIPKPVAQVSRGVPTGLHYVPMCMRNSAFKDLFYGETFTIAGKKTEFVEKGEILDKEDIIRRFSGYYGRGVTPISAYIQQ